MLAALGECMVEVSPVGDGNYRVGYAGDTFNAAWASRALLPRELAVRYVTAVGTDWVSDGLFQFLAESGLDLAAVRRDPVRSVGLYAVRLIDGERSFAYWRAGSAATAFADDPGFLEMALHGVRMALFSGITLAILPPAGRDNLHRALAAARRNGTRIVFDPNYRARLWPSEAAARDVLSTFCRIVDCVLPSFSDEAALFGDATPEATAARFQKLGVEEIIVKNGAEAALCVIGDASELVAAVPVERVVDTTGAGDAFNGAYLAARLQGALPAAAVGLGHRVAALSVQHRGALIPKDALQRLGQPRIEGMPSP